MYTCWEPYLSLRVPNKTITIITEYAAELRIGYSLRNWKKEGKPPSGERNLPNTNRAGMSQNAGWQAAQVLARTAPSVPTTNMSMVNINFTEVCITPASYVPSDNSILEHCSATCRHRTPLVASLHFGSD